MDRNEILANFQACSGNDDIGECMAILEQCEWDLQRAVSAALEDHPTANSFQNAMSERKMITFSCRLGETTKDVMIDDSSTVGDLKQIASIELGISTGETNFESWPKESAVRHPNDNTVLSTMALPHFNQLTVKMQSPISGVSIGLDTNDDAPLYVPCAAYSGHNSSGIIDFTKTYRIQVRDEEPGRQHFLSCEGSKTVLELKMDIFQLTKIHTKEQIWEGFPGGTTPSDDSTIASLRLTEPLHNLSVRRARPIPAHLNPFSILPHPNSNTTSNGSHSVERGVTTVLSSSDEEDIADSFDDDSFFADQTTSASKTISLMPEKVEDDVLAQQQFKSEFLSRYVEGPEFHLDTLVSAVQKAFGCEARRRKLLAVYLHHDGSIQSNVFCSQLLANHSIINYLNAHFVTWGWDLTTPYNKERFLQMSTQQMGSGVADSVRRMRKDHFPMLILAQGKGRSCDVTAIIQGNSDLNELMARLIKAYEDSEAQKLVDIQEEDARKARENIKREQEEAYRQSLEADRAKLLAEEEQVRLLEYEEKKRQDEEQQRQEKVDRLKSIVPPEPETGCGEKVSRVRFRCPDGKTLMRSFLATNTLQDLVNYVGSMGFPEGQYRILKSWPKVNVSSLDLSTTLEANKIYPQDSLIIEEHPEYDA